MYCFKNSALYFLVTVRCTPSCLSLIHILMLDIKSVKEYCEKVVKEDVNSSVLTGLNESIDNLKLGDDKTKQYKAELKKAFQEYFLPAYSDIIKTMKELDSSKNNTLGLSHMKNGKEYYELLFKQATGTDK